MGRVVSQHAPLEIITECGTQCHVTLQHVPFHPAHRKKDARYLHSCFSTFSCYSNGHLHIQAVLAQPLWSTKKSAHKKLLIHRLSPETLLTFGPKRIGIFVCRFCSRSVGPNKRFERQLFQVNALQLGTCRQIPSVHALLLLSFAFHCSSHCCCCCC